MLRGERMPHRAKAEEAIKRRMTEIQDIVETCNLAPYKMDEYKKELKKLNELLVKHRERKGFTAIEGAGGAVVIACILIAIVIGGVKKNADRRKEVTSITGEIERVEYVGGGDASNKTNILEKWDHHSSGRIYRESGSKRCHGENNLG